MKQQTLSAHSKIEKEMVTRFREKQQTLMKQSVICAREDMIGEFSVPIITLLL